MTERVYEEENLVVRHSPVELIEHWAIALSGLILVLTGIFQMPTAQRYYITTLPGLAWSGDFLVSLNAHYAASVIFVAAALFHVVYHGVLREFGMMPQKGDMKSSIIVIKSFFGKGEEPPFHKYLPEQRLAYIGMAVIIFMLIFSGLLKTYKNIYAPDMALPVVLTATWAHNIFFALFCLAFIAHIGAVVLKPNRPMVRSIFTGRVRLDYARRRHPLWMAELEIPAAASSAGDSAAGESPQETAEQEETAGEIDLPEVDLPAGQKDRKEAAE